MSRIHACRQRKYLRLHVSFSDVKRNFITRRTPAALVSFRRFGHLIAALRDAFDWLAELFPARTASAHSLVHSAKLFQQFAYGKAAQAAAAKPILKCSDVFRFCICNSRQTMRNMRTSAFNVIHAHGQTLLEMARIIEVPRCLNT